MNSLSRISMLYVEIWPQIKKHIRVDLSKNGGEKSFTTYLWSNVDL